MLIQNTLQCYVQLWQQLELTWLELKREERRFCVRSILKRWLGKEATDDFIWEVMRHASKNGVLEGWTELPQPSLHRQPLREVMIALVMVKLGIGKVRVKAREIDAAYRQAFGAEARTLSLGQ